MEYSNYSGKKPKTNKLLICYIIISILIVLATFGTGIGLTLTGRFEIGSILIRVGSGLIVVVAITPFIYMAAERYRYFHAKYPNEAAVEETGEVEFCGVHSTVRTTSFYGTKTSILYVIFVKSDDSGETLRFLSSNFYPAGKKVKFLRYKNKKRRLIEE